MKPHSISDSAAHARSARYFLKLVGTSADPCREGYTRSYVDFAPKYRPDRRIRPGDHMVLYAVGGSKRVFALAEVTSEVYPSGDEDWPRRLDIKYKINLPVSSGVPIDGLDPPGSKRVLSGAIPQACYFELSREEYELAAAKLREASKGGGIAE